MSLKIHANTTARLVIPTVLLTLLLSACSDKGVQVQAQFANTQDISDGTPVYLEDQIVGEVVDTDIRGQGADVLIRFDKDVAKTISDKAAVIVNRFRDGAPLEVVNRESAGDTFIQEGQQLTALDSMFELGAWMVGDAIQLGTSGVTDYLQSFQNYLKSDEFQRKTAEINAQINIATQAAKTVIQQVEQDVDTAIQQLTGSEQEMAAAVEQLGEDLSPMVEELGKSGTALAAQLRQFSESLRQTTADEQQAGKQLMDSLLKTLEKLNQDIEQSVQSEDPIEQTSE